MQILDMIYVEMALLFEFRVDIVTTGMLLVEMVAVHHALLKINGYELAGTRILKVYALISEEMVSE